MYHDIVWIVEPNTTFKNFARYLKLNNKKVERKIDSIDHNYWRVVIGSIPFVQYYYNCFREYENSPDLFYLPDYDTTKYYPVLKDNLLNSDCFWVPYEYLYLNVDKYFEMFNCDRLFIRPDSGDKRFTGTTIGKKWARKELDVISGLPHNKTNGLVLVSSYKNIDCEARFLIGPKGIVDFSFYQNLEEDFETGRILKNFVDKLDLSGIVAGPFFTLDVCLSNGAAKIIEMNSFNCAGFYNMDYYLITKAVEDYFIGECFK